MILGLFEGVPRGHSIDRTTGGESGHKGPEPTRGHQTVCISKIHQFTNLTTSFSFQEFP